MIRISERNLLEISDEPYEGENEHFYMNFMHCAFFFINFAIMHIL